MTDDELKQDRAIIDAATPGPWTTEEEGSTMAVAATYGRQKIYAAPPGGGYPHADQQFIAAARTRWPVAIDEVERLRLELIAAQPLFSRRQLEQENATLKTELAELRARDGYKVTSAHEFDWPLVGEAARRIAKIVNDIGFTAPEALDLHQIRATEVCQAIDAIVAALKLQRLEDVRSLRAELATMRPVVDAAVGYCMSPSGCHLAEDRLVEAAGIYAANRAADPNYTGRFHREPDWDAKDAAGAKDGGGPA